MALKIQEFASLNKLSVLVHYPEKFDGLKSNEEIGYVTNVDYHSSKTVFSYLQETLRSDDKIKKALAVVQLSNPNVSLSFLTNTEKKKVELARVLLLSSKIIVCDHFFDDFISQEKNYFKRFFRNLGKRNIAVILVEDDMNFVCETVKEFYLFSTGNQYKLITDFYDEEIYQYVDKPFTVDFIKYCEQKGHHIDHEITFDETLKAIYRGES